MKEIAHKIISCFAKGNKILICGNGGSASQSNHFTAELVGKFEHKRRALPAISLTSNDSIITSIGNDFGFEQVFSRQVEALGLPGDILIILSTSGSSKNCLKAIKQAEKQGLIVINFPRKGKNTAEIQDYQVKLMHKICRLVEENFI